MGQQGSRPASAATQDAIQRLGPNSTQRAQAVYEAAGGDEARKVALSPTQLGSLLGGNAALGTRVVAAATALGISPAPNGGLTFEGFIVLCACITAGTSSTKAKPYLAFLANATGPQGGERASTAVVRSGLHALLPLAYARLPNSPADKPSDALVEAMVEGMQSDADHVTNRSFRTWLQSTLYALKLLDLVLWPMNVATDASLPALFVPLEAGSVSALLDPEAMMVINSALPKETHGKWHCTFDSGAHGCSFAKFRDSITKAGPCVVVVRDKDGHVFGGFASQPWDIKPNFYGDERSFLFSVRPKLLLYLATGANENFQYFNFGTETLPNGLGMGGQFNYNGLWLASDLLLGHSKGKPCSTFGSPPLAGQEDFLVDHVETWSVGGAVAGAGTGLGEGRTIFQGRAMDEAVLEMAGKTMHGKAYREQRNEPHHEE